MALVLDLVVYLDLSIEEISKRAQFGDERYETVDMQKKVAECFRTLTEPDWVVLDASKPIAALEVEVKRVAMDKIREARGSLQLMW